MLAHAVVSLSNSLKLETIAEGVKEIAQIEFLQEIGCNHFSRPITAEEFVPFWHSFKL